MMILPFAALATALWLASREHRVAAMWTWAGAIVLMLVLFRLHANEVLALAW